MFSGIPESTVSHAGQSSAQDTEAKLSTQKMKDLRKEWDTHSAQITADETLARAKQIKEIYQDTHYVFLSANNADLVPMFYLINTKLKKDGIAKTKFFKYVRAPEHIDKTMLKNIISSVQKSNSYDNDHSEFFISADICDSNKLGARKLGAESADYFLRHNVSVKTDFQDVICNIISDKNKLGQDFANKIIHLADSVSYPVKCGNLFVFCIPKDLLDKSLPDTIVYRSHGMGKKCDCHDEMNDKKILQALQENILNDLTRCKDGSAPQYRLIAPSLTPDKGVLCFMLTPFSKEVRKEIKEKVVNMLDSYYESMGPKQKDEYIEKKPNLISYKDLEWESDELRKKEWQYATEHLTKDSQLNPNGTKLRRKDHSAHLTHSFIIIGGRILAMGSKKSSLIDSDTFCRYKIKLAEGKDYDSWALKILKGRKECYQNESDIAMDVGMALPAIERGCYNFKTYIAYVYSGVTLFKYKKINHPDERYLDIAIDFLETMINLHSGKKSYSNKKYSHNGLNLSNVTVDKKGKVHLIDYGFASETETGISPSDEYQVKQIIYLLISGRTKHRVFNFGENSSHLPSLLCDLKKFKEQLFPRDRLLSVLPQNQDSLVSHSEGISIRSKTDQESDRTKGLKSTSDENLGVTFEEKPYSRFFSNTPAVNKPFFTSQLTTTSDKQASQNVDNKHLYPAVQRCTYPLS